MMNQDTMKAYYDTLDIHRLKEVCLAPLDWFNQFGERMDTQDGPLIFRNSGASVLAVAHLDSVQGPKATNHFQVVRRPVKFGTSERLRTIVHCGQLDDRLGAYVIVDLLEKVGIKADWLLTDGEEKGRSTAAHFKPPRQYNWIFQFDRKSDDTVLYSYDSPEWRKALVARGFRIGHGSVSDISYLTGLGCKAMNIGTGYYDYHLPQAYAILEEMIENLDHLVDFYGENEGIYFPHAEAKTKHRDHQAAASFVGWSNKKRPVDTPVGYGRGYWFTENGEWCYKEFAAGGRTWRQSEQGGGSGGKKDVFDPESLLVYRKTEKGYVRMRLEKPTDGTYHQPAPASSSALQCDSCNSYWPAEKITVIVGGLRMCGVCRDQQCDVCDTCSRFVLEGDSLYEGHRCICAECYYSRDAAQDAEGRPALPMPKGHNNDMMSCDCCGEDTPTNRLSYITNGDSLICAFCLAEWRRDFPDTIGTDISGNQIIQLLQDRRLRAAQQPLALPAG